MGTKSTKERHDTSIRDKAALCSSKATGNGEMVAVNGLLIWYTKMESVVCTSNIQ